MFLCVKNADVYSPAHLGKKDILICNDRIIAMEPELKALPEGCRDRGMPLAAGSFRDSSISMCTLPVAVGRAVLQAGFRNFVFLTV